MTKSVLSPGLRSGACACLLSACALPLPAPALVLRAVTASATQSTAQASQSSAHAQWLLDAGLVFHLGRDPKRAPQLPQTQDFAEPEREPQPAPVSEIAACEVPALCHWEQQMNARALAELSLEPR